jgi:hypothetical protein
VKFDNCFDIVSTDHVDLWLQGFCDSLGKEMLFETEQHLPNKHPCILKLVHVHAHMHAITHPHTDTQYMISVYVSFVSSRERALMSHHVGLGLVLTDEAVKITKRSCVSFTHRSCLFITNG